MTIRPFGRIMPVHEVMLQLVGYESVGIELRPATGGNARKRAMRDGLHWLRRRTNADFGYDVESWREFLIKNAEEFGYKHPYAFEGVDKAVLAALNDPEVIAALSELADS